MKTAYELAMERLDKSDPESSSPLTSAQKAALKEVENQFQAKIAEKEIFLQKALNEAIAKHEFKEVEAIKRQLQDERIRFESECEEKKERIRQTKDMV